MALEQLLGIERLAPRRGSCSGGSCSPLQATYHIEHLDGHRSAGHHRLGQLRILRLHSPPRSSIGPGTEVDCRPQPKAGQFRSGVKEARPPADLAERWADLGYLSGQPLQRPAQSGEWERQDSVVEAAI